MVFQTSTQNEKSKQVIFGVNSGFSDVSKVVTRGKWTQSDFNRRRKFIGQSIFRTRFFRVLVSDVLSSMRYGAYHSTDFYIADIILPL